MNSMPANVDGPRLVWIFARQSDRPRVGSPKDTAPVAELWSRRARIALSATRPAPDGVQLDARSDPQAGQAA
eukprot:7659533-Alexandrium_andersonii.AAC.1